VLVSFTIPVIGIALLWLLQRYPNFWMMTGTTETGIYGKLRPGRS
jgi:hypothetical protein